MQSSHALELQDTARREVGKGGGVRRVFADDDDDDEDGEDAGGFTGDFVGEADAGDARHLNGDGRDQAGL